VLTTLGWVRLGISKGDCLSIKTSNARRVLLDACAAHSRFINEPTDVEFRHLIVLCATLLRAVGHVLKTENSTDEINSKKLDAYYKENIQPQKLFSDFIKTTRDSILKEYSAHIGWASVTDLSKKHHMEYLLKNGIFEGEDFRNLMKESLDFWELHIATIEKL
jgi:hypothetical protein